MSIKPLAKTTEILIQELENEVLIYDLRTNKAFCLNETSAMIYQLCNGTKSISDISNLMSQKFKTLVSEDFVWLALNELKRNGLLENAGEMKDYFVGKSRREAIKKAGLVSMIALPIISSVVAPSAVNAQSVCLAAGEVYFIIPIPPDIATCEQALIANQNLCCSGMRIVSDVDYDPDVKCKTTCE